MALSESRAGSRLQRSVSSSKMMSPGAAIFSRAPKAPVFRLAPFQALTPRSIKVLSQRVRPWCWHQASAGVVCRCWLSPRVCSALDQRKYEKTLPFCSVLGVVITFISCIFTVLFCGRCLKELNLFIEYMPKTEVILTHNIVGLGGESDQVKVAAG